MRNIDVSIAKAIAIILMVLVHARFSKFGGVYINMFHMPLFFFFSGYCFKEKYLDDVWEFAKKRIRGIYVPFVKWSLVFLALHNVFFRANFYNGMFGYKGEVSHLYDLPEFGTKAFYIITRMTDNEQLLGGYWFLSTLFWCSFIAFAFLFVARKYNIGGGKVIIASLVMTILAVNIPYFLIGIREMAATTFFLCGYYYRKNGFCIESKYYIIPICALIVFIGAKFCPSGMLSLTRLKVLPYIIFALAGTIMIFSCSKWLSLRDNKVVKFLAYIGDNTLTILTWHFLCFKIISLQCIKIHNLSMSNLAEFPVIESYARQGWWILYSIIGVLIPIWFCRITELLQKDGLNQKKCIDGVNPK